VRPYYQDDKVTLYHGDALALSGVWICGDVLISDPPYGMAFVSSWTIQRREIANDKTTEVRDAVLSLWFDKGMRPAAVFGTWKVEWYRKLDVRHRLIWDKQDGSGTGMGDLEAAFGNSDEEVYIYGDWRRSGKPRLPSVLRTSDGMSHLATAIGHPTPKPISLMARLVHYAPNGMVVDPFSGSGSTLVAAKNLGRTCVGVELDERYCEIAARRLSQGVLDL
jgi:hypothetical protein